MNTIHSDRMPVWFIGHGSPMNAIENNNFTRTLHKLGESLTRKPAAILVISAHWLTRGTFVSTTETPDTIYDFFGFPNKLYQVAYPAAGSPEMATFTLKLIKEGEEDYKRGLDHGAWSILLHLFPKADIPVFQVSIDINRPLHYFVELGSWLKPLRNKGVLVIGSGNIVHNLQLVFSRPDMEPYDWAIEFDEWIKEKLQDRDIDSLVNHQQLGSISQLAVPTPDHYIPMLCCAGFLEEGHPPKQVFEEIISSLSMRCFTIE